MERDEIDLTRGYTVLPSHLSEQDCQMAVQLAHAFLHDTSSGQFQPDKVSRVGGNSSQDVTKPTTLCNGAGWLFNDLREKVADTVYSTLLRTRELISSNEGFIYHEEISLEDEEQIPLSHDDLTCYRCLLCVESTLVLKSSSTSHSVSFREQEIKLHQGDVFVWKVGEGYPCTVRDSGIFVLVCMYPANSVVGVDLKNQSLARYKERRTTSYKGTVQRHSNASQIYHGGRQYFRFSPAPLTIRQAQLYGLLPYLYENLDAEVEKALLRGVRFEPVGGSIHSQVRICKASLEVHDGTLNGPDKYLGGMTSSCGTYVYGVPGHAKSVMRIDCRSGKIDFIGPDFVGKFKWLRGLDVPPNVMNDPAYPSGCCLALPCNHASILKINPSTSEVKLCAENEIRKCGASDWLYHGGSLAPNGWLYAIPANAKQVLKFNPTTEEAHLIGPSLEGGQKFYGGILGSDNRIYGVPHNASSALVIDPSDDRVALLEHRGVPMEEKNWKFHGGLRAGTKIYCFPNNSDSVLVIDCEKGYSYLVDSKGILTSGRHRVNKGNRYKYLGGALSNDGRFVYLFPCDAERVMRIDTATDELHLVGPLLLDGENKFQNGFAAKDGCLYAIPQRSDSVLQITPGGGAPEDDHVEMIPLPDKLVGVKDKFEGGVMGKNGLIYMIPLRSDFCVQICPNQNV